MRIGADTTISNTCRVSPYTNALTVAQLLKPTPTHDSRLRLEHAHQLEDLLTIQLVAVNMLTDFMLGGHRLAQGGDIGCSCSAPALADDGLDIGEGALLVSVP